jgi:hypothetical protein
MIRRDGAAGNGGKAQRQKRPVEGLLRITSSRRAYRTPGGLLSVSTDPSLERWNALAGPSDPTVGSLGPLLSTELTCEPTSLRSAADATGARALAAPPGGLRRRDPSDPAPTRTRRTDLSTFTLRLPAALVKHSRKHSRKRIHRRAGSPSGQRASGRSEQPADTARGSRRRPGIPAKAWGL